MSEDAHRWLEQYPELGTGPISTEPYISSQWYEREKEKIFRKTWLCVGRADEIPKAGDYKVKKLAAADTSVILIRGKDGQIRAFHNACAHRGNTVVTETDEETFGGGKAAIVTCRFHGWVYDAEGRLKQVPSEKRFYDCFSKADNGLAPVHCDSWEGFIFVNVAAEPETSLLDYLGDYARHFAGYPFEALDYGFTYRTYLDCNWKVAHDAFAEAYHVDTIHAGSFPNVFSTGLQNVKLMGPHRSCAVCLTLGAKPTPIAAIANGLARASLVSRSAETMLPPSINPDKRGDFAFELSVLFPNTLIHVSEGIWFTHQFWPMAHNRTLWEGRYYVKAPKTCSERWATEHAMTLQRNAWLEDTATMEDTQRAMQSRAKLFQHLQDDEILIRHGAVIVDRFVNA
ncbi:aromatic ring-hydroxylating dioxygenase subunit alpha [Sphingobium terrigena]|uniref:Aromatic ring-hydroxylating dioxygenase subunit alpha n=1 Tax=Sphingobium terrigena TaxID=2304063 RepID=A0A418YUP4_9SPHN|nr:aromatic ring-hydroxylating dioxygenase subunit alpha [Sphingobium terrigena]RJG55882.1 aromatic ring-hydroxylating dioxygenase subunit alpha [Sphingobium terrigena]